MLDSVVQSAVIVTEGVTLVVCELLHRLLLGDESETFVARLWHDRQGEAQKRLEMEAGEGTRTLDLRLGKPTLYQLSYAREAHTLAILPAGPRRLCPHVSQTVEKGRASLQPGRLAQREAASSPGA